MQHFRDRRPTEEQVARYHWHIARALVNRVFVEVDVFASIVVEIREGDFAHSSYKFLSLSNREDPVIILLLGLINK